MVLSRRDIFSTTKRSWACSVLLKYLGMGFGLRLLQYLFTKILSMMHSSTQNWKTIFNLLIILFLVPIVIWKYLILIYSQTFSYWRSFRATLLSTRSFSSNS